MKFNDCIWARTFNRLRHQGVPHFFCQYIETKYSQVPGIEVYTIFEDAQIVIYHDMVEWYSAIMDNHDLVVGFLPHGYHTNDISEMVTDQPACAFKESQIFQNRFWVYNPLNC